MDECKFRERHILEFAGPLTFQKKFYEITDEFLHGDVPLDLMNTLWRGDRMEDHVVIKVEKGLVYLKSLKNLGVNQMGKIYLLTDYNYLGKVNPKHIEKPKIKSKWLDAEGRICTIYDEPFPTWVGLVYYKKEGSDTRNSWNVIGFHEEFTPYKPSIFKRLFGKLV